MGLSGVGAVGSVVGVGGVGGRFAAGGSVRVAGNRALGGWVLDGVGNP